MLHGTGGNPHIVGGNRSAGFLQGNADDAYRSDVSSSTTSTLTREDSRNSRNSRSLLSRLLPWRKPAEALQAQSDLPIFLQLEGGSP